MATTALPQDAPATVSAENLQAADFEPPDDVLYEVVDGRVVESPPMGAYESDIANYLAELINQHARNGRLGRAFVEVLFRIDVARDLQRRPDVAFVSAARWPFGKRVPRGEAWDTVPNLAIEVVSKSNSGEKILEKVGEYFRSGTELVWVVYPLARQVYVYTSATEVRILVEPANLDGGNVLPGFHLSLNRLFEDEPTVEAT